MPSTAISQNPDYDRALEFVEYMVKLAIFLSPMDFEEAIAVTVESLQGGQPNGDDMSVDAEDARLFLRVAVDVKNGFVSPRIGNVREILRARVAHNG